MEEIDRLIAELLHELDEMTIEELETFRPEMMEEIRIAGHLCPASEKYLNKAFDYVIKRKQEKARMTA